MNAQVCRHPHDRHYLARLRAALVRVRAKLYKQLYTESTRPSVLVGIPTSSESISDEKESQTTQVKSDKPRTQRALVVASKGTYEIREDFPVPSLGDKEVMIRSRFVGLNPIDWKSVDYNFCMPEFPWVNGREMSGIVEEVGASVTTVRPGDLVWTSTYYRDIRAGCFQELVVVPQHTVARIPEGVSPEMAACLGVPALTACMTLWKWLSVPLPSSEAVLPQASDDASEWILIWGGSAVTGQFATQVASRAGYKVVTVTSSATKALSAKLGATHVVTRDGKSTEEIVAEIKSLTQGVDITRAIDLVGPKTAAGVLAAVSTRAPVHFAPLAFMDKAQEVPENVTVHTVEMKQFVLDESSGFYAAELTRLLEDGQLTGPDIHVLSGGLEDIQRGLDLLKSGNMMGKKIVVQM